MKLDVFTMHIALPNQLEEYVNSLVQTDGYAQPSEVIAEALSEHRTRRDGVEIVMTPQLESLLDAGLENLAQGKSTADLRHTG